MRYSDKIPSEKKSMSSFFIGSASGIAVFLIIMFSVFLKFQVDSKEKYIEALRELSSLRFHVENIFNKRLALAKGVVAFVKVNSDITKKEFTMFSDSLLDEDDLIRNITLIKGTVISFVYPYEQNKAALGVDLATVEGQKMQILKVKEIGEPIITGIINLVQGGRGIIFRMPIFLENDYWGQASIVINADKLFEILKISELSKRYDLSIKRVSESDFSTDLIYGNEEIFFYRKIELEVNFGNAKWKIGAIPKNEKFLDEQKILGSIVFSLFISIIIGYIIGYTYQIKNVMKKLAYSDALTGVPNRLSLNENFMKISQAADKNKMSAAVLVVDINKFKEINDTYGHIAGDEVLKKFAKKVSRTLNSNDILMRTGGDEFLILLSNISSNDDIDSEIYKIKELLRNKWTINNKSIEVAVSIGFAVYPNDAVDIDELIHHADLMMYEEKKKSNKE